MKPLASRTLRLVNTRFFVQVAACLSGAAVAAAAAEVPIVTGVEAQPLVAQIKRLVEAREFSGEPFSETTRKVLAEAMALPDPERASVGIQKMLDPHCLFVIQINPESRVKVARD